MEYKTIPWAHKEESFLFALNRSHYDEKIQYIDMNLDMDWYTVMFDSEALYGPFMISMKKFGYVVQYMSFDSKVVGFGVIE